jgi:hypothetical protein
MKTYGALLMETQTAIEKIIEGAQEYEIGGRRLRRADLQWLYERERMLMEKLENYGDVTPVNTGSRFKANVSFV